MKTMRRKNTLASSPSIAVTSRSFSRHPILRAELGAKYSNVRFNDDGLSLSSGALIEFLSGADRAITALEIIDANILEKLPQLKVISKYGVGIDMLDLPAMVERGICLGWTGGVNKRSVSELVIAFAISLLRHIPTITAEVCAGTWRQTIGRQISDQVFGIIGCGHVGKDLGQLLRAFGCRVLAHDILEFPDYYASTGIEPADLDTLLQTADIVTLHLPLDHSTKNILSAQKLALMPNHAMLINAARGSLVDEDAVKSMLKEGKLAGAAFDVLHSEPPTDFELINLPNVIVTPHIGGSAEEAILNMGRAAIAGLEDAYIPSQGSEYWPV
jgi:phosphoglycerate dehydrogenase-like enzyme